MAANNPPKVSVERYGEDLKEIFARNRMVVFLCGPSLTPPSAEAKLRPGAQLRARLQEALEKDNFEVVLGEDDGLESLQKQFAGMYAHENELSFIRKECGAIVLIADSVGSYCELGLFAHIQSHEDTNRRDFILIVDQKFKEVASYLNLGPAKAVRDFGIVFYVDLATFELTQVIERLQGRRAVYFLDGRGRPARSSKGDV